MRFKRLQIPFPSVTRSTMLGFVLSALGLLSGSFGLTKLVAGIAGQPVSMTVVVASLLIGIAVGGTGFLVLVASADPFDDTGWDPSNLSDNTADSIAAAQASRPDQDPEDVLESVGAPKSQRLAG